jgi:hypothetical protein
MGTKTNKREMRLERTHQWKSKPRANIQQKYLRKLKNLKAKLKKYDELLAK